MISTSPNELGASVESLEQRLVLLKSKLDGWTRGNETNPSFDFLKATQAQFYYPPTESARWRRTAAQSITNNAWNTVVWDEETWNFGPLQYSTASTGIFTFRHLSPDMGFLLTGFVRWNANSSGERLFRFNSLTTDGQVSYIISDPKATASPLAEPFIFVYHVLPDSSGFNFQVWQNGEAPSLDLNFAYLGVMPIAKWKDDRDNTTFMVLTPPSQITWTDQLNPNTTQSTAETRARDLETSGGSARRRRGLIQFATSAIPVGVDILSATLELFVSAIQQNAGATTQHISIDRASTAWTESVTWNTQPTTVEQMGVSSHQDQERRHKWNLSTASVSALLSSNFGMIIKYVIEPGTSAASMHTWYGESIEPFFDRKPRLVIHYTRGTS